MNRRLQDLDARSILNLSQVLLQRETGLNGYELEKRIEEEGTLLLAKASPEQARKTWGESAEAVAGQEGIMRMLGGG